MHFFSVRSIQFYIFTFFCFFQPVEKHCRNLQATFLLQDFQMVILPTHTAYGESLWPQGRRYFNIPLAKHRYYLQNKMLHFFSFSFKFKAYIIIENNWITNRTMNYVLLTLVCSIRTTSSIWWLSMWNEGMISVCYMFASWTPFETGFQFS